MINIALTISTNNSKSEGIWVNGISQNIINLYFLLRNTSSEYNVFLVNTIEKLEYPIEIDGLKCYLLDGVINDIHILFEVGLKIEEYQYNILKNNKTKIVHYNCGANYFLDMETILFGVKKDRTFNKCVPDQVWTIPQNYETNKYYYELLYKTENIEVPFIWSPFFIDNLLKKLNLNGYYTPNNENKNISVFEPNINIVKYSMYPILIVEKLFNENKKLFNKFYLTNSLDLKESEYFMSMISRLGIFSNDKIIFEGRYKIPYFLDKYTDVVLSHQIYNPLNYAYLDALYLDYPFVHNADIIKDSGYYYSGFDVEEAKNKLKYALTEHDNNLEEYKEKSKKILERYLPTNEKSIYIYKKLINNLLNK